ncbi:P-loop NTPase family protein [Actinomarinicola tropica]|uniref:AAA family ATPase n=1 Tax=Actinomarinicola tropica TaxID=2789776 RepID=A0A5Q2RHL7_9ACTN|nr:AAA family ATPase [Actinomarinicola tropica]QGG94372.1 AAA family ATPase [Actinomarinicola tropica]
MEAVLVEGLKLIAAHDMKNVPAYHRAQAQLEQYELSAGGDLCYDRPGTGFAYAAWYHPRRVHELVRRLHPVVGELPSEATVLDLGAGTGAAAWALALALRAREIGGEAPRPTPVRLVALDASPSMLEAGQMLWQALTAWDPRCAGLVTVDWVRRAWLDPPDGVEGGWVIAGHLFDASDTFDETRLQFRRMLVRVRPDRALIDAPWAKEQVLLHAVAGANEAGWDTPPSPPATTAELWDGTLEGVQGVRSSHLVASGLSRQRLGAAPSWLSPSVVRADLVAVGGGPGKLFTEGPIGLALDDDQDRASAPRDNFEVLIGAAGSGKSVVLVERVARTIEHALRRGEVPSILVTTRNVPMVDQLHGWILDRLGRHSFDVRTRSDRDGSHDVAIDAAGVQARIRLLNWDKVPTRLFGLGSTGLSDRDAITTRIHQLEASGWTPLDEYPEYLRNVEWLEAELRRVIYAQRLWNKQRYLGADRVGRVRPLQPQIRELVWHVLRSETMQSSYTYKWIEVARTVAATLETGEALADPDGRRTFTHGFIDEVQDFTETDVRIAASMVPDAQRLYCVGDGGQAMLLASTFDVPGIVRGRRREVTRLSHSYRMGRRLAEAVQPLAQHILDGSPRSQSKWVGVPGGTRSGVLGCRPIIIEARPAGADALASVLRSYGSLLSGRAVTVTIAEAPEGCALTATARNALPSATVRRETMARIKGLERTCVIWQTSRRWALDESAAEFVHTVLTRATALAIIVVDEAETPDDVRDALRCLRADRLLFWDASSERTWMRMIGGPPPRRPLSSAAGRSDIDVPIEGERL